MQLKIKDKLLALKGKHNPLSKSYMRFYFRNKRRIPVHMPEETLLTIERQINKCPSALAIKKFSKSNAVPFHQVTNQPIRKSST